MTAPHHLNAPDGSFAIGDGEQWGQNWDVDVVQLLTMGGILPDPNNIFGTIRNWLGNLPLEILQLLFRPLLPLSTDADWVDTPTAVNTILSALPLQQMLQFFEWVKTVFEPFKKLFDDLLLVLSGVLVNPGGVLQPVAEVIGSLLSGLRDLVAGLIGLFGGVGTTVQDALNAIGAWLGGTFKNVSDGVAWVIQTVHDLLDGLFGLFGGTVGVGKTVAEVVAAIQGWLGGTFKAVSDSVTWVVQTVHDLLDALFGIFGGTAGVGKTVAEVVAAIQNWLGGAFKNVADGLAALVTKVQDLIDGIFGIFGGIGVGKTVAEMLKAVSDWLTGVFTPFHTAFQTLLDTLFKFFGGVDGVGKTIAEVIAAITGWFGNFQKLLDTLFKVFGGVAGVGKTIAEVIAVITSWFGDFQKLLDALFSAFGGITGTGKTIAEVITAITGWFTGVFKKLIDGINGLMGLIPGLSPGSNPIQDAINVIAGILGIGNNAAAAAAEAQLGVEAILAGNAGGMVEDFSYPAASNLPTPAWKKVEGADNIGTDGAGSAVFSEASGATGTWLRYVQTTKPLPAADMKVTAVLTSVATASVFSLEVCASATDKSCYRVEIDGKGSLAGEARFYKVSTTGAATLLRTVTNIPDERAGVPYVFQIKGTSLSLSLAGGVIATATVPAADLAGRCIGFGMLVPSLYVNTNWAPKFNGLTWQAA